MSIESLWPDNLAAIVDPKSPQAILEEQARALGLLTNNKVLAKIEPGSHGELIVLGFVLMAPALHNYRYFLFKLNHGLRPEYPAEIILDSDSRLEAKDEIELRKHLKAIFGSDSTRSVIGELMAFSPDEVSDRKRTSRRRIG
ncbi:MAG: hypothetical protein M3Y56_16970 [Armatimonadota bacterium]|nr:hypothetical protein [Armatimonadota bacterium]